MLEKEEWRYDQFPEFYNGSNVLDFYDPDIERKLDALEKEEAEILKQEALGGDMMDGIESEDEDGIGMDELKASLAEVRSKKAIFKNRHRLKGKLVVRDKKAKVSDMIEHFESIGVKVNKESLRSRSKTRRGIADLENAQDRKAGDALDGSDDDEMPVEDNPELAAQEMETRGRKRRRERSVNPDDYAMDVDDEQGDASAGIKKRNLTPSQRTISAQKIIRSKTKDRREGSEPKRLPYKLVPEEQVRLAKKITKRFRTTVNVNEADRHIATKRPKHLFAGKMSNGTKNKR